MKTEQQTAGNQDAEARLTRRGIQPTAMRQRVLDYLLAQPSAQSRREIEQGLVMADRATLHRTLKVLESRGLVHPVEDGGGALRYAVCREGCRPGSHQDAHLHFYCRSCGRTYCLYQHAAKPPALTAGYETDEYTCLAKGTCPSCKHTGAAAGG